MPIFVIPLEQKKLMVKFRAHKCVGEGSSCPVLLLIQDAECYLAILVSNLFLLGTVVVYLYKILLVFIWLTVVSDYRVHPRTNSKRGTDGEHMAI